MNKDRAFRSSAALIAAGAQVLMLLAFVLGLGMVRAPQPDAPAMVVALLPTVRGMPELAASKLHVQVHMRDPSRPPVVPVEITLPTPPVAPDTAMLAAAASNAAAGSSTGSDSGIGIVSQVEPEYPESAVKRRAQGITKVRILVTADGHPAAVRVQESSGDAQLDAAAVRGVEKWIFSAATANSHVVAGWAELALNFNLKAYHQEHPAGKAGRSNAEPDPVATLNTLIKSWSSSSSRRSGDARRQHNLQLLSPELSGLLEKSGPVRSIRFLGFTSRPPDSALLRAAQQLRTMDALALEGWYEFEITQQRGVSQWYCAVDTTGQIQDILIDGD